MSFILWQTACPLSSNRLHVPYLIPLTDCMSLILWQTMFPILQKNCPLSSYRHVPYPLTYFYILWQTFQIPYTLTDCMFLILWRTACSLYSDRLCVTYPLWDYISLIHCFDKTYCFLFGNKHGLAINLQENDNSTPCGWSCDLGEVGLVINLLYFLILMQSWYDSNSNTFALSIFNLW